MMDLNKRQFAEVVLDLAKRYQVPVKTLAPEQRQELQRQLSLREQLFEVLASTSQFYQYVLRQDIGQQALQYLQRKRFLKTETVEKFALGYAPPGWETLYHYLVENKNYPSYRSRVNFAIFFTPMCSGNESTSHCDEFLRLKGNFCELNFTPVIWGFSNPILLILMVL